MVNYKYIFVALICLSLSVFLIIKNKFHKRKERDLYWATGYNFFLGSIVLAIFALLILYYEFKKILVMYQI
jgi:hypothetical protein